MLADFTITVHEARKPLAVRVKIHDSTAALRMAARKRARLVDPQSQDDFSDVLGLCHRSHMMDDPVVALVRLAPPHIGAGVIAHEMAHAAVQVWNVQHKWEVPLNDTNDEWFCWVLGELVRQTTIQLIERKIY